MTSPKNAAAPLNTRNLKKKPLLEAILEVKWTLREGINGSNADPLAKLLPGLLFAKLNAKYPHHEQLPQASLPDEVTYQSPQHRFRRAANQWPLFQIGPGILTLNETAGYEWGSFRQQAEELVAMLFDVHPMKGNLKIDGINLRYIDSVSFDPRTSSVYDFLKQKMGVTLNLPSNLFDGGIVDSKPETFTWQSSFPCTRPAGRVMLSFGIQNRDGKPSLIWDTQVVSRLNDVPKIPAEFADWVDSAHGITHDWFFKLIAGELEKQFDS